MQLTGPGRASSLRSRLGAAACVLLAAGAPAAARAEGPAPTWQVDLSGLVYGEAQRTAVVEPNAKITRLFANGQSLSGSLALDAITGASPSGAVPSGRVQTYTTPSGQLRTTAANQIPTNRFNDFRGATDLEWKAPFLRWFTSSVGTHFSREKDYQSLGASGQLSVDFYRRLFTLTVGGGENRDVVLPTHGTPIPLSDTLLYSGVTRNDKRVSTRMVGLSHVMTRRWLAGVYASETRERGYLTEPYKVVSLVDAVSGYTNGQLTENRPDNRLRRSILGSSVYHFEKDVLYLSYRRYWDDWGVQSHTFDARWRVGLANERFLQPHVRFYTQRAADFFRFGVPDGAPLPRYVSSDERLGPLHDVTLGATYGFRLPQYPGEWTLRAELMEQWGDGHPADAIGAQKGINLFPPVAVGSLVVGYTVGF